MELDKDFREFIELLNKHNVKYLVIGGYAVNFHGYPRYTKDIDFWLYITRSNIQNLINASEEYLYQFPQWKRIQFDILSITILKNEPAEYFFIEDVYV
mgnify:CR=1 FL=1